MNIQIGTAVLKLVAEQMKYFPKNVRAYPLSVLINGNPGEFRLTTGVGRDGEKRRYAHVLVDGKAFWAKLTDDVVLVEPSAKILTAPVAPVAEVAETTEA